MIIPHRAVLTDDDGVAVEVVELTRDTVLRYLLVFTGIDRCPDIRVVL